jgi:uncharacterized cupredoxin-like copper-binding protein
LAALVTAASLVAAAPADASTHSRHHGSLTHAHTVDITGTNTAMTDSFKIDTHGTVPAGLVKIRFTNTGTMDHQAQLFRLHDGVTYPKFLADLHGSNPFSALLVDSSADGGPATMAPGHEQTVWEPMQGGTYAVVCLVTDNGVPHFDLGMVAELTVAGHMSPERLAKVHPAGEIEGTIKAHDMTYTIPSVIRIGALYRYEDTDAQDTHEVTFGKLLPGKTAADAKAWFAGFMNPGGPSGPPPFVYAGGFGAELPGNGGWLRANLTPGNYVAFCLVPDDKTDLPHAAMGMVVGFRAAPDYDD